MGNWDRMFVGLRCVCTCFDSFHSWAANVVVCTSTVVAGLDLVRTIVGHGRYHNQSQTRSYPFRSAPCGLVYPVPILPLEQPFGPVGGIVFREAGYGIATPEVAQAGRHLEVRSTLFPVFRQRAHKLVADPLNVLFFIVGYQSHSVVAEAPSIV